MTDMPASAPAPEPPAPTEGNDGYVWSARPIPAEALYGLLFGAALVGQGYTAQQAAAMVQVVAQLAQTKGH